MDIEKLRASLRRSQALGERFVEIMEREGESEVECLLAVGIAITYLRLISNPNGSRTSMHKIVGKATRTAERMLVRDHCQVALH